MAIRKVITVVAVDESVLCRYVMGKALAACDDIELLAVAPNGKTGLAKVLHHRPDVVVVAIALADIDVYTFVDRVRAADPSIGVVLTTKEGAGGGEEVVARIGGGAELVSKPVSRCEDEAIDALARRLVPRIRNLSTSAYSRIARDQALGGEVKARRSGAIADDVAGRAAPVSRPRPSPPPRRAHGVEVVLIGASAGGPDALSTLLPTLSATFPVPVLVSVHMPGLFTGALAQALDTRCEVSVVEARDGQRALPGTVYLSPGERHLTLYVDDAAQLAVRTRDRPPVDGHRPSVDLLFRSALELRSGAVVAVILTGMGNDGSAGLSELKRAGAFIYAQDEASSVVWGMPGNAVRAGLVDEVVALGELGAKLRKRVGS